MNQRNRPYHHFKAEASQSATVVLDDDTGEIKIFVGDNLRGRYKDQRDCATHFAATLIRTEAMQSVLSEILNEELPAWMRQKIRDALSS